MMSIKEEPFEGEGILNQNTTSSNHLANSLVGVEIEIIVGVQIVFSLSGCKRAKPSSIVFELNEPKPRA